MAETTTCSSAGNNAVTCIACGSSHSLALIRADKDLTVSWGRGEDGQLGHGDAEERLKPQGIYGLVNKGITSVHCGAEYSVAVSKTHNQIYSWGWGDFGRLGHGECKDVFIPTPITSLSGKVVASVSCGDTHTLVATEAGELFSFGRNQNGQLGYGNLNDSLLPQQVTALADQRVVRVACGAEHSVCSTDTGEVYAWGWGRYGNIGDGHRQDRHVPTQVQGLAAVKIEQVACGWRHNLAVDDTGALYTWGWSKYGQLGHGDYEDQMLPKKVEALKKVALVAGGWRHTLAANEDGKLYAWGWNKFGQLGVGHNEDLCAPGPVVGLEGEKVQQLSSGWKHTLVVTESGKFYGWGRGVNGQLGRGDTADANTPVLVPDLSAGGIAVDALMKETHPVVMYSIPPGDRYAVVPDHGTDGGNGVPHAVPDMEVPTKKQRV